MRFQHACVQDADSRATDLRRSCGTVIHRQQSGAVIRPRAAARGRHARHTRRIERPIFIDKLRREGDLVAGELLRRRPLRMELAERGWRVDAAGVLTEERPSCGAISTPPRSSSAAMTATERRWSVAISSASLRVDMQHASAHAKVSKQSPCTEGQHPRAWLSNEASRAGQPLRPLCSCATQVATAACQAQPSAWQLWYDLNACAGCVMSMQKEGTCPCRSKGCTATQVLQYVLVTSETCCEAHECRSLRRSGCVSCATKPGAGAHARRNVRQEQQRPSRRLRWRRPGQ